MNKFNDLISSGKPVLVDFYAEWCGPCKMMKPILEDVKAVVADNATIIKIDVDKNPQLAAMYHVQSVPTLMLFRNNEIKWRQAGVVQAKYLQQLIAQHI